ncbi:hypothetical protein B0J11DRAFT_566233 [Dendryphion nanum]|uniref:BTB domain-containing protein n=1 Tax=Dendryphion nanum TaxID=256645 RepID=A0A9P9E2C8_9PLEO|nr:hypothetical protein B0J11DRAFT_566233 [Dendryphion nanum]
MNEHTPPLTPDNHSSGSAQQSRTATESRISVKGKAINPAVIHSNAMVSHPQCNILISDGVSRASSIVSVQPSTSSVLGNNRPTHDPTIPLHSEIQGAFHSSSSILSSPAPSKMENFRFAERALEEDSATRSNEHIEFKPFQYRELLRTPIQIIYGQDRKDTYTVHLELLRCYSRVVHSLFDSAEEKAIQYQQATKLRKDLKNLLPPKTATEEFDKSKANQALTIIHRLIKSYPLIEYQKRIQNLISTYLDQAFADKANHQVPPTSGSTKKKSLYQEEAIEHRLQHLSIPGVLVVGQGVFEILRRIKLKEKELATQDRAKAAAQRNIYLPNTEESTLNSVVHWIYRGELRFENASNLCKVQSLAEELSIRDLAESCLSKLYTSARDALKRCYDEGIGIQTLLIGSEGTEVLSPTSLNSTQPNNMFHTVFMHALTTENAPDLLQELVADSIAFEGDSGLYDLLEKYIKPSMQSRIVRKLLTKGSIRTFATAKVEPDE